jgi:hypothetical protein
MATIIAGHFDTRDAAEQAVVALRASGFPAAQISCFYVGPAGQHSRYRLGGDHDKSPGAEKSARGTVAGAATGGLFGAAIGAVTTPVTGPLGPIAGGLVGAHIGNLVGALSTMKGGNASDYEVPPIRHSGFMVAVSAPNPGCEQKVITVLMQQGAAELESGTGHIVQGDWQDFDPAEPPHRIDVPRSPGMPAG